MGIGLIAGMLVVGCAVTGPAFCMSAQLPSLLMHKLNLPSPVEAASETTVPRTTGGEIVCIMVTPQEYSACVLRKDKASFIACVNAPFDNTTYANLKTHEHDRYFLNAWYVSGNPIILPPHIDAYVVLLSTKQNREAGEPERTMDRYARCIIKQARENDVPVFLINKRYKELGSALALVAKYYKDGVELLEDEQKMLDGFAYD